MNLSELEEQRRQLLSEISTIGDMHSGTLSIRYQRCSNRLCVCHAKGHKGHGPIYSFSMLVDGKTKIRNYKLGPELAKLQKESENYQRFKKLTQELTLVNNAICEQRPVTRVSDNEDLEELKKKLKKQLEKKYHEKLDKS